MKKIFLSLFLSVSAFGATFDSNLYPQRGHIEMHRCEAGVRALFNVWTTDRATLTLKNFKLGQSCGAVKADARNYVLRLKSQISGNFWVGTHPASGRTVRVYDYRHGAGPHTTRVEAPFIVEELDAQGKLLQRLYPPIGAQG